MKIEGGIVQEIVTNIKDEILVLVVDKDDDSDPSVSITEHTPIKGNIIKEINESLLSDAKAHIGINVIVTVVDGDDFMATLMDAKIDGNDLLLVVKDQDDNVFDVKHNLVTFDE